MIFISLHHYNIIISSECLIVSEEKSDFRINETVNQSRSADVISDAISMTASVYILDVS